MFVVNYITLALGKAEGKDADLDIGSFAELLGTGENGGASGDHIVDNEQMLALNGCGIL